MLSSARASVWNKNYYAATSSGAVRACSTYVLCSSLSDFANYLGNWPSVRAREFSWSATGEIMAQAPELKLESSVPLK